MNFSHEINNFLHDLTAVFLPLSLSLSLSLWLWGLYQQRTFSGFATWHSCFKFFNEWMENCVNAQTLGQSSNIQKIIKRKKRHTLNFRHEKALIRFSKWGKCTHTRTHTWVWLNQSPHSVLLTMRYKIKCILLWTVNMDVRMWMWIRSCVVFVCGNAHLFFILFCM